MVFEPRSPFCRLCSLHPSIVKWVHESLVMTHAEGHPRPAVFKIYEAARDVMNCPVSKDLWYDHLRKHEPAWRLWDPQ